MVSQRDIVEVEFELPQGRLNHPVIVLSSNEAIKVEEEFFFGVMVTSKPYEDEFTFELEDSMFNNPLRNKSQARLHLIGWFSKSSIIRNSHNQQMKKEYFKNLVNQITQTILYS